MIEVTKKSGDKILINPNLIMTIEPTEEDYVEQCIVYFSTKDYIELREPYDKIKKVVFEYLKIEFKEREGVLK